MYVRARVHAFMHALVCCLRYVYLEKSIIYGKHLNPIGA